MSRDLAIFRNTGDATTVAYTPGATLQGSAKLVTRFASLCLSDYDASRDRGTAFSSLLRAGSLGTSAQVTTQFALARAEVTRQLGDQSAYPESEQLETVTLTSFTRAPPTLLLEVQLGTPEGIVDIQLPVGAGSL